MRARVAVVALALLVPVQFVWGAEKAQPAAAPGSAPSAEALEVSALMRDATKYKGPVQVEGIVSNVFPKDQKLGLIDTAEFKHCGVVTCAEMVLPVRWNGAMPEPKSLVRVEGEIQKNGARLEFVARSLEKASAN